MKMRFALIVLLSISAVVVHAQDTVLYGRFHASIDFVDNGGTGNGSSSVNVSSNSSRFGIRGSEQIAPGLKGIFQVESSIDSFSSQNSSSLAGRDTFVGLEGGFGEIRIGRNDTPFKKASRVIDLFGDQAGDSRNIVRFTPAVSILRTNRVDGVVRPSDTVATVYGDFDARLTDSVMYTTPSFAGFEASLLYVPDEADGGVASGDVLSVSATYKAKMFDIVAAFEQKNEIATALSRVTVGDVTTTTPTAFARADAFRIGGNVRLGAIRIAALYQRTSFDQTEDHAYGIGASYKFGQNLVKAQFYAADNEAANNNAQMFALGFERNLSKRTRVYAVYAKTANDSNVRYNSFSGGHGRVGVDPINGETFSGFSLGVLHNF